MDDNIAIIERQRNDINKILKDAQVSIVNKKLDDCINLLITAHKFSKEVYEKTLSNRDRNLVIFCIKQIIDFYENYQKDIDSLYKWNQEILLILEDSCKRCYVVEDYRLLLETYIVSLNILNNYKKYNALIELAKDMKFKSKLLYRKTKTYDDLKYLVIANLYLANSYKILNMKFKAYCYYVNVSKKLEKVYYEVKDEGMKNDLLDVYNNLYELAFNFPIKLFRKKWKYKILGLKENIR